MPLISTARPQSARLVSPSDATAETMRSRGGAPSSLQHDHMLQENDDQLAALGGKVSALRALSYDIEGEVRSQNELLEDMARGPREPGPAAAGARDPHRRTVPSAARATCCGGPWASSTR